VCEGVRIVEASQMVSLGLAVSVAPKYICTTFTGSSLINILYDPTVVAVCGGRTLFLLWSLATAK